MAVMTRDWTVGIDAGGTWLRVLAVDGSGRRRVMRRPASHDLPAALRAIWRRWRLGRARVSHLVVATRGVWTASERRAAVARLRGLARRVTVLSDAEAAHLGALGGGPGLLVLAGTGAIVLGRGARGGWVRAGGLEIGSEVRFAPERGEKGPQASSVHLIGKHSLGEFAEPKK